jgi:hypothetical protein
MVRKSSRLECEGDGGEIYRYKKLKIINERNAFCVWIDRKKQRRKEREEYAILWVENREERKVVYLYMDGLKEEKMERMGSV